MTIWNKIFNLILGLSMTAIIVTLILSITFWMAKKFNENDQHK